MKIMLVAFLFLAAPSFPLSGGTAPVTTTIQVTSSELVIGGGPQHQEDPHISGSLVTYSDLTDPYGTMVRYYDLTTGSWGAVAHPVNTFDFVPDVSDGRITFTRIDAAGSFIQLFDLAAQTTRELDPGQPNRLESAIGGNTVAWVESVGATSESTIAVHDLTTSSTVSLPHAWSDVRPSVSPDGTMLVWTSCDAAEVDCDIRQATRDPAGWTVTTLTGASGREDTSDTDGAIVVYDSLRSGERNIYWQPAGGGAETELSFALNHQNPSVRDGLIVFEAEVNNNYDVYAYDTITATLYRVTSSPEPEMLSDLEVVGDAATVVYTHFNGTDNDVLARSFTLNRRASADVQLSTLRALIASSGNQLTKALDAKLRAAENALATGDTASACASLQDFINHVAAQRGKKITVADADAWTVAAQQLRSTLGCA